ncbi:MAG: response regulator [Gammaproteobacteria bacterium]|nr:response regulator [Gammaproteobacteria bacterium]
MTSSPLEQRALVWATGRDGQLTCSFLMQAGLSAVACGDWKEFNREIERGAGVLIIAGELLTDPVVRDLEAWLAAQPPWSDVPIIAVESRAEAPRLFEGLGTVSVLYRPLSPDTLCTTVRAALRARLRQYQVRDLLQQRENFLAMLAHELRNPLAPIRTGLQVLRLADSEDTADRVRAMIERQVATLSRLIDDLLDVSRISRGKISLKRECVDLGNALWLTVEGHRRFAAEKAITLTLDLPEEQLTVQADPTRLEQMIGNVLINAIKFTPDAGAVTLSAAREKEQAVIRVRDTGIGIPRDMLERVFELFTQTERSIDRSQGGLGIGLTLVRTLADMHGGSVEALSDGEGKGTEIVVRLPVCAVRNVERPRHGDGAGAADRFRKVLLVEDNRDAAAAMAAYLRACGHTVHVAHDGIAGMRAAMRLKPEVVIADIGLPGLDGYELARLLRAEPQLRNCLLVAVTGYGEERDRERATTAGFQHYLVKPADPAAVHRLVISDEVPA